jgi:hypothetical protein
MWRQRQKRLFKSVILGMMFAGYLAVAQGQMDGYASASYGFHKNPLYNYETVSDQVREGYLELNYTQPSAFNELRAGYVGGLMIFNRIGDRNYYEHRLNLGYALRMPAEGQNQRAAEGTDDDEGQQSDAPFQGKVFDVGLRLNARHDKEIYRTFDNIGLEVPLAFTWGAGSGTEFRLAHQAGVRRYYFLKELDNITDVLESRLTMDLRKGVGIAFFATTGLKRYTTDQIDTSQIETSTTTFTPGNKGKGKGGSGVSGQGVVKKKQLLVNSTTTSTYQVTLGLDVTGKWDGGTVSAGLLYRLNPKSQVRFLAQYANTSLLSQDIYNDSFSYGGPALKVSLKQRLPFNLELVVLGEAQRRKFLAPGLDLAGFTTSENRVDVRGQIDGTLSRTFPLNEALGIEVAFNCGTVRNQSDDAYNDYSLTFASVSIGMEF